MRDAIEFETKCGIKFADAVGFSKWPADLNPWASNDVLEDARAKLASGELKPCAPCDGMYNEWTEEEKLRFKTELGKAFGWK